MNDTMTDVLYLSLNDKDIILQMAIWQIRIHITSNDNINFVNDSLALMGCIGRMRIQIMKQLY